eukprot:m.14241 g.14241  ORF g.14241 m.14241 type:complete len:77 (+) comp4276_c0_seq2:225-455(+)
MSRKKNCKKRDRLISRAFLKLQVIIIFVTNDDGYDEDDGSGGGGDVENLKSIFLEAPCSCVFAPVQARLYECFDQI